MSGSSVYEQMVERLRGHQLAAMLQLAARLDLSSRVGEGIGLPELADGLALHPRHLKRLMRALSAFGVFEMDARGRIKNNEASWLLSPTAERSLHAAARFWGMPAAWAAWSDLGRSLEAGDCGFEAVHGRSLFEHLAGSAAEGEAFDNFMMNSPDDRHAMAADALQLRGDETVVDIGGGNGALLATLLQRWPGVRGVLLEQGRAIEKARARLAGLEDRTTLSAGDMFQAVPSGGDLYILSQIIHDWSDEEALVLLGHCRRAMAPSARLVLIERRLDGGRAPLSRLSYLSDIEMMVLHTGCERMDEEYAELLSAAGFELGSVTPTAGPFALYDAAPCPVPAREPA